jgi:signal transduction histidine kinase
MPDTPLALDRSDGSLERIQATLTRTAELHDASARLVASCGRAVESRAMVLRAVSARSRAQRLVRVHDLRVLRRQAFALADVERRRIAADLHDGAQQRLSVLGIRLVQLVECLEDDPPGARSLARQLVVEVDEAIAELRRLVHGVYPAVLTDHGLAPALRAAARTVPIPTAVHTRRVGRYPGAVESAVYFTCMEALQNAIKHAPGATEITVKLAARAGRLEFDVSDNGSGVRADAHAGHGFASMQARIASVAGQMRIDTAGGAGTHVVGSVPLDDQPPRRR